MQASHERVWHVRANQVVLATGAHERPLVFQNNDRPGIMLASAVRAYLNRYAVRAGQRIAVFTQRLGIPVSQRITIYRWGSGGH